MIDEINWDNKKTEWQKSIKDLVGDIRLWAENNKWIVVQHDKSITEDHLGTYQVPELNIKIPGGHLIVEPIGRNIIGAEGRVDIYAFPSLQRMLLVREHNHWSVKTSDFINWPLSWDKNTFTDLAKNLIS